MPATSDESSTGARSTNQVPSSNLASFRRASSIPSRVLPPPAGPVIVTTRWSVITDANRPSASSRPSSAVRIDGSRTVRALPPRDSEGDDYDEKNDGSDDLPSSYGTIVLNNKTIYKTRTKPKNSKPFFNAGTERFIRDWRNTEVIVTVRDSRTHEDDPLLGFVYLPLEHIFNEKCQTNENYPLSGGTGHGRVRISMVFRSVYLQAPPSMLGWDYGTLEVVPRTESTNLPPDFKNLRLKVRTNLGRGKMYYSTSSTGETQPQRPGGVWTSRRTKPLKLAVRKRYASPVIVEFKKLLEVEELTLSSFRTQETNFKRE